MCQLFAFLILLINLLLPDLFAVDRVSSGKIEIRKCKICTDGFPYSFKGSELVGNVANIPDLFEPRVLHEVKPLFPGGFGLPVHVPDLPCDRAGKETEDVGSGYISENEVAARFQQGSDSGEDLDEIIVDLLIPEDEGIGVLGYGFLPGKMMKSILCNHKIEFFLGLPGVEVCF